MDYLLKIKDLLRKKNLTQRDFSKKIGVSLTTTNSYLTGKTKIDVDTLIKIAKVLDVPVGYFFDDSDYKEVEDLLSIGFSLSNLSYLEKLFEYSLYQKAKNRHSNIFYQIFLLNFVDEFVSVDVLQQKEYDNVFFNSLSKELKETKKQCTETLLIQVYELTIDFFKKINSITINDIKEYTTKKTELISKFFAVQNINKNSVKQ